MEEKKIQVTFKCSKEYKEQIKKVAKFKGRTLTSHLIICCDNELCRIVREQIGKKDNEDIINSKEYKQFINDPDSGGKSSDKEIDELVDNMEYQS